MASNTNTTSDVFDALLQRIRDSSENNLLPAEITHLTSAFLSTRPDSATVRPKAYLILSAFCQGARASRGKESDVATKTITKTFGHATLQYLGETDEISLLTGLSFLTALFQVDSQAACSIFTEDGLVENLTDSIDLSPSDVLSQNLAHLLGQACGHKSCRAVMSPQIVRWLEFKSGQTGDPILRGAAAVALIKMSKGAASDGPENGTPEVQMDRSDKLAAMMVDIVISEQTSSMVDAIEGLGYLSMEPTVKELLSKDKVFLKKLFALVPKKLSSSTTSSDHNPTMVYGVLVIVCNLVAYRPRLSEEQKQVENLKRMTKTKTGKGQASPPEAVSSLENDDHVKVRIHSVLEAGVLSVFSAATSSTASLGVRVNVGKSLLSIVEEKENRGQVLQAGGAKVLQIIIRKGLSTLSGTSNDRKFDSNALDLEPIQALAKLAITSSPVHVFGPNVGAMYDAIRPFSIMLQHPSSNLLQRFEAIMALTNLSSYSADMASRIASAEGLLNKVELLLLEEHTLVRRASMELICNLIAGSDTTFERYSGGESSSSTSKIHVLLALSDVDDLPTRLAASGALATLTSVPSVCHALIALQSERHRFLPVMTQLIDPSAAPAMEDHQDQPFEIHPGLVHRGIVCIRNVFSNISDDQTRETIMKEAKEAGLIEALVQLLKRGGIGKEILQQAAEALTLLAPVNRT